MRALARNNAYRRAVTETRPTRMLSGGCGLKIGHEPNTL